jgi:hypothetical protein
MKQDLEKALARPVETQRNEQADLAFSHKRGKDAA